MVKKAINKNEKEKYRRFYNGVIVIAWLMIISLVIVIPKMTEMLLMSDKERDLLINESTKEYYEDSAIITGNSEVGQIPVTTGNLILTEKTETEYFVVVEELAKSSDDYFCN